MVSPSLVSTRFTLLDNIRLGNASLSTVYPEGRVTSITAMLLSLPPRYLNGQKSLMLSPNRSVVIENRRYLPGADGQLQVVGVGIFVNLWIQREQRPFSGHVDVVLVRHFDNGETGARGRYVYRASAFRKLRVV